MHERETVILLQFNGMQRSEGFIHTLIYLVTTSIEYHKKTHSKLFVHTHACTVGTYMRT